MGKNRYISTSFWDDTYITTLDPIEKLVFNYCLTNPLTSICGIYEISMKRIGFDTGLDREMAEKILKRFEVDKKMKYEDGWLAIKNFIKHQKQSVDKKDKVSIGIATALEKAPINLKNWVFETGIPLTRGGGPSISGQETPLNYLNSNFNLNSNINLNTNLNSSTPSKEVVTKEEKTDNSINNDSSLGIDKKPMEDQETTKDSINSEEVEVSNKSAPAKPSQKQYTDIIWQRFKEIAGFEYMPSTNQRTRSQGAFWTNIQKWIDQATLEDTYRLMNLYEHVYSLQKTQGRFFGGKDKKLFENIQNPCFWADEITWIRTYNIPEKTSVNKFTPQPPSNNDMTNVSKHRQKVEALKAKGLSLEEIYSQGAK